MKTKVSFLTGLYTLARINIPHKLTALLVVILLFLSQSKLQAQESITAPGANPNPACLGATITLTDTITGNAPTGSITFVDAIIGNLGAGPIDVNGIATITIPASMLGAGSHSITASYPGDGNNAPISSAATTVIVYALPTVNLVPSPSYCAGTTAPAVNFTSDSTGVTFSWTGTSDVGFGTSGTGSIPSFTVTNATSSNIVDTVSVTATKNGCTGAAMTFQIHALATPIITASPPTQAICTGTNITTIVFANTNNVSGTVYTWTRDDTVNVIGMNGTGPGGTTSISGNLTNLTNSPSTTTFTITGSAGGCSSTSVTAAVTVNPPPTIAAISGPTSVCTGSTITLTDATGGGTWSSANTTIATVNGSGVVTGVDSGTTLINYTVTSIAGCKDSVSYAVNVNQSPTITAAASATTICAGTPVNLSSTGSTTGTTTVSFTATGPKGFADGNRLFVPFNVSGLPTNLGAITSISITVNVSHQHDLEVEMYLLAPGGTVTPTGAVPTLTASAGTGIALDWSEGGTGNNFVNTVFTDKATTPISAGVAPFTGSFKPEQAFSTLLSTDNPDGTWNLVLVDHVNSGLTGVFNNATLTFTYGGGADTYSWTSNPAGFTSTLQNPGAVSPTQTTTYTVVVTDTATKCTATSFVTVTVNPADSLTLTSGAGTNIQTVCSGNAITNITYKIGGSATGANVTGLPAGLTSSIVGGILTISGTPTAAGTYTVTTTGGSCPAVTANGTITLGTSPTIALTSAAGTNAQTVCINSAITNIQYTVGGSATGAASTGLPTGVTGVFAGGKYTISGTPTVSGAFTYTVTTAGGLCGTVSATGTITVVGKPTITLTSAVGTNAQTICANTVITNITYSIGGGGTGATVSGLPAGVNGAFSAGVVTISGTPTATGSFTYTVTTTGGAPCAAVTATGTITVNVTPTLNLT